MLTVIKTAGFRPSRYLDKWIPHFSRAEELVAEGRRIVQQQKGLIVRLRAAGVDTGEAERTLRLFEANLRRFEEHRTFSKVQRSCVLRTIVPVFAMKAAPQSSTIHGGGKRRSVMAWASSILIVQENTARLLIQHPHSLPDRQPDPRSGRMQKMRTRTA